jgi:DNA helicase-4
MTVAYVLGGLAAFVLGRAIVVRVNARLTRRATLRAQAAIAAAESLQGMAADHYLRNSSYEAWMTAHPDARRLALSPADKNRLRGFELEDRYAALEPIVNDPAGWVDARNEAFVQKRSTELSTWFENRFSNPLTHEQRRAVVTDEDTNLVVAGAGSGKTATVIGKLAYLIEHLGVNPAEILVLAFNRTVAKEISDRIAALGLPAPEVSTFHAKGLQVLADATGRKPSVSALATDPLALGRFLESVLITKSERRDFRELLAHWWVELRVEARELKRDTPDERLAKERSLGLRTLDGTLVRSQAEVKVGDWLTLHGIAWEHEARYPHSPPSRERSDYTPDFYLPEHDVWIEVWSCDEAARKFPPEIAAEQYHADMEWKRSLHPTHGTALLEINQTDIWGGRLSEVIEERLRAILEERRRAALLERGSSEDVEIRPLDESAVETQIEPIRTRFNPFINLIASFLKLFRAGGWDRSEVTRRAQSERDRRFLELFWPFLDAYEAQLQAEGKIDFDAMLIEAARALEARAGPSRYRYIVVDEYQDTSRVRFELIRRLRGRTADCQLFLVGDDWQSIYRFAGADVTYFTRVDRYFGKSARTDLGRTFRLTHDVAELSTRFVTRNPNQLAKRIEPRPNLSQVPAVSIRLHGPGGGPGALKAVLDEIAGQAGKDSSVLVLARYNFALEEVTRLGRHGSRPIQALTVHRAKGLEADYVIVIDLKCGILGFPTEIEDDPVLRLLLGEEQHFPNAEERRLFYVALTRARSRVYLLGDANETSPFLQELLGPEYAGWVELFGDQSRPYRCPRCGGRTIHSREGPYGPFWGCMHYPACRGRLPACKKCGVGVLEPVHSGEEPSRFQCSHCKEATRMCPRCHNGALVEREGPHSRFLGCSEWRPDGRGCDHTEGLHDNRKTTRRAEG